LNENPQYGPLGKGFFDGACLKFKEIIRETIGETARIGNFIRIYPSKDSDKYDRFF
jgi:hypothetical protein